MSSRSLPFFEGERGRAVGGGDDANVHGQVRGTADAIQSLGFEHAKQA